MSLEDELKRARLRKVDNAEIKDFSSPRLAGFLSQAELDIYTDKVVQCNLENWYHLLGECTFATRLCPITKNEARLIISIYEQLFKNKTPDEVIELMDRWRLMITGKQKMDISYLEYKLDEQMRSFQTTNPFVFVKTSSRSAKDSPLASVKFREIYYEKLGLIRGVVEPRHWENEQIIVMLKSAFECLKMRDAREVIDSFIASERIYQDMLLAIGIPDERFNENFIIREFFHIEIDMEFRGFVCNNRLTALSQYNYLIYSPRLNERKFEIQDKLQAFFYTQVVLRLQFNFPTDYVIDFALLESNFES